jgi:acid phosphatase (class A)
MRYLLATLLSLAVSSAALLVGSSLAADQPAEPSVAAKIKLPPGYLRSAMMPDSLKLLPAPPAPGSAGFARDEAERTRASPLRGTPRWALAASDADLHFPHAPEAFACAADRPISRERTPRLYGLLGKMLVDVGLSTYRAKDIYKRTRPFVVHKQGTCTPAEDKFLAGDGSYPSGHSAVGWGWALVLAELVPLRAHAILQRGREFGHSRVVCNAHWQSDVEAGQLMAAATVARLHADPTFAADLAAARAEVARIGHIGNATAQCVAEAAALGISP